ncbi:MAG: LuxR C-terminal-related transcriptional regulator [Planctomycetota bacterium]
MTVGAFAEGNIVSSEATGAVSGVRGGAALESQALRPGSATALGWWIADDRIGEDGAAMLLRDPAALARWNATPAGRRWAELGVDDFLFGAVPLHGQASGRMLLVELGVRVGSPRLDEDEQQMLQSVLPYLARRASLAFGPEASNPMNRITPREQLILEQLTLGKTVKQIAATLKRSPHTIHDHVKSLHRKLNANSRGELIARTLGHIGSDDTPPEDAPELSVQTAAPRMLASA